MKPRFRSDQHVLVDRSRQHGDPGCVVDRVERRERRGQSRLEVQSLVLSERSRAFAFVASSAAKTALPAGSVPAEPGNGASAICAATPDPTSSFSARTAVGESISRTYRSALPRSTPPVRRAGFLIFAPLRMWKSAFRRDRDDVGAPQVAVAPGPGRRVQLRDRVRDVVADPEGRVREATTRLRHLDDVRPLLERLRAPREVGSRSARTSMPLSSSHSTRRFASASLRWPAPTGITCASGYSVIQLLATSNGGGQHGGRAAFSSPRM